jgi:transposase-like protein
VSKYSDLAKCPFDLREAVRLHASGMGFRTLANRLGVHRNTLREWVRSHPEIVPTAEELAAPVPPAANSDTVQASPEEMAKTEARFEIAIGVFEQYENVRFDRTSRGGGFDLRFWRLNGQNQPELVSVDVVDHRIKVIPSGSEVYAKALKALEISHDDPR